MASNQHRRRRSVLVSLAPVVAVVALVGCDGDTLVPDGTIDGNVDDDQPPATDTRTTDPPTMSNLPITSEP
jgi:hypothetical protein